MLVLSRKKGESIMIGDDVEITVIETEGDTVKLGIRAPRNIDIFRKEVYLSIREANTEASKQVVDWQDLQQLFKSDGKQRK